jgi:hypothetical protein
VSRIGVSDSAPFKSRSRSRSRVYWLRPSRPRRVGTARGALDFAFTVGAGVGVGVSGLDFPFTETVAARCLDGEREGVGGGESIFSDQYCPSSYTLGNLEHSIPSPLLLSDLACLLFAASALAAAACSFCFSLISRSRLFFAAAPRRFCLPLAPVRVGISSMVAGDWLRLDAVSEELEVVRWRLTGSFKLLES